MSHQPHGKWVPRGAEAAGPPLLEVDHLAVDIDCPDGAAHPVRDLSYAVRAGETIGLVGESGCGKTLGALAVIGLLPPLAHVRAGSIRFEGKELVGRPDADMRGLRGRRIGMVFQDPLASLNPVMPVAEQIGETLVLKKGYDRAQARIRTLELLEMVGIPAARSRARDYPYQFSGGMRQRIMIATALACDPALLIADEPTTALDVTVQAQVLDLISELQTQIGLSVLIISHDLGVVARIARRIAVMYAGQVVETGPTSDVLASPKHPYTLGLIAAAPRLDNPQRGTLRPIPGSPPGLGTEITGCAFAPRCSNRIAACADPPLLSALDDQPADEGRAVACFNPVTPAHQVIGKSEAPVAETQQTHGHGALVRVDDLRVSYPLRRGILRRLVGSVRAVDGVSLEIVSGETLGLVGESGSGKSTLGRALLRLDEAAGGTIYLGGEDLAKLNNREMRGRRKRAQMIFQDPYSSLDPHQRVRSVIAEPIKIHGLRQGADIPRRVAELLELVGLDPRVGRRYPHEFSGGQRQRIGIARALAVEPELVVCDEPVSSLDVSIQAQIIGLLERLQRDLGLTVIFISHDLGVVRHIADRIAVLYLGKVVEIAPAEELFKGASHPYTAALISAAPTPDPHPPRERIQLFGEPPSPSDPPPGCRFHTRCWLRQRLGNPDICATTEPSLDVARHSATQRHVACHFAVETIEAAKGAATSLAKPGPAAATNEPLAEPGSETTALRTGEGRSP